MTDKIQERLRKYSKLQAKSDGWDLKPEGLLHSQAADYIEQLEAENQALQDKIDRIGIKHPSMGQDAFD